MTLIELIKSKSKCNNGVYFLEEPQGDFENIYINVRRAEGRIYSDEELKLFPDVGPSHRQYYEWRIRNRSMEMLLAYLESAGSSKTILEPGCGSGWLSSKLAGLNEAEVIGLDVNETELCQAARVFSDKDNLLFVYGNFSQLPVSAFDYIVLSGVIAYFEDLPALIRSLSGKLKERGEIHITDSPFYDDIKTAKERSGEYYRSLGFPEMSEYYHHHSLDELKDFKFTILHDPHSITGALKRAISRSQPPFHWVKIINS